MIAADTLAIETNTVFELLANERRRHILLYLHTAPQAVPMDELVTELAGRETTAIAASPANEHQRRTRIDLEHAQLPRLADAGVLTYEQENEMVVLLDPGKELAQYLDTTLVNNDSGHGDTE